MNVLVRQLNEGEFVYDYYIFQLLHDHNEVINMLLINDHLNKLNKLILFEEFKWKVKKNLPKCRDEKPSSFFESTNWRHNSIKRHVTLKSNNISFFFYMVICSLPTVHQLEFLGKILTKSRDGRQVLEQSLLNTHRTRWQEDDSP
jgi:hypothetical protein